MKRSYLCLVVLTIALCSTSLYGQDGDIALMLARTSLSAQNYEVAIAWFDEVIKDFAGTKAQRQAIEFLKGAALFNSGKRSLGMQLMQSNYDEKLASDEERYYLALAHFEQGRVKRAKLILKSDNDSDYTFSAMLLKGRIELALDNRKNSYEALRKVKMVAPQKLADEAKAVMDSASFTEEEKQTWGYKKIAAKKAKREPSYNMSMGVELATNVSGVPIANEESPPLGVEDAQDLSINVKLGGHFPMKREGDKVKLSVDKRHPVEVSQFDQDVVHLEYESTSNKGKSRFTKAGYLGSSMLDGKQEMNYFGALFDYSVKKSQGHRWRCTYNFRNEDHDEPNFPQEDRDGSSHTLNYTHYFKFGKGSDNGPDRRDEWGFGLNIRSADLDGEVYSMTGFGPRIEWKKRLGGRKSLDMRYLYWANDYDGAPVLNPAGPKRRDWRNQVDLRFSAPVQDKTRFWSRVGYTRNKSSDTFQDRKNFTVSAGLSWSF